MNHQGNINKVCFLSCAARHIFEGNPYYEGTEKTELRLLQ